ncbi:MAG: hypothetical protein NXI24_01680 [bacterium]|nr:hypothetical protein [bacterium]
MNSHAFARALRLLCLITLPLAVGANCTSFASAEVGRIAVDSATDAGFADQAAVEPGQVQAVALRFTAWGNHERYVDGIRERLRQRGYRLREKAPDTLELVLEESGTTPGFLRLVNFIATIATGTVLPFYNQVNYRLAFRHFRQGELQSVCRYELRNNELVGVLMIPFAPFRWPTSVLNATLIETVDAYAYGCRPLAVRSSK